MPDETCEPTEHDFQPRCTYEDGHPGAKHRTTIVLAIYCRKCGTAKELPRDQ